MSSTAEQDRAVLAPHDDWDSPTEPLDRVPLTALGHRPDGKNESRPPRWLVPTIVCLALLVAGLGGFVVARASQMPSGNTKTGDVSGASSTTTGPPVTTASTVPVAAPSTAPAPVPTTKVEKSEGCGPTGAKTTTTVGRLSTCHHRHGHG